MADGTPPVDEVALERARLDKLLVKVFGPKLLAKLQTMEPLLMGASAAVGLAAGLKVFSPSEVVPPDLSQVASGGTVIQVQGSPGAVIHAPQNLSPMERDPAVREHHYRHDPAPILERRFGTLVEFELMRIFAAPEEDWNGMLDSVRSRYDTDLDVDRRVAEAVEAAVRAARSARISDASGATRPVAGSTPGRARLVATAAASVAGVDLALVAIHGRTIPQAPAGTLSPNDGDGDGDGATRTTPTALQTSDSIWAAVRRASSSDLMPADVIPVSPHRAMAPVRSRAMGPSGQTQPQALRW